MKKLILFALSIGMAACNTSSGNNSSVVPPDGSVKNVIYMIGDGMGLAHVTATKLASETPLALLQAQATGLQTTHSASSEVTDSAASGTALATGEKTNNGSIGVDVDGQPLTSVLKLALAGGKKAGVVVTSSVTHATPAAFMASVQSRNDEEEIAEYFTTTGIDLFIGGGKKFFEAREDGRNLSEELRTKGYTITYSLDDVKALQGGKVGALLADNPMPSLAEGRGDMLLEAVGEALRLLSTDNPNGFFLMVEGSQIDWAAHANDGEQVVAETIDFDKAVKAAMDFADRNPGTLVVVTADHETGGLALPSDHDKVVNGVALPGDGSTSVIAFATKGHTGSMVPVYAYGTGAYAFTGVMDNTDIPKRIAKLMGLPQQ